MPVCVVCFIVNGQKGSGKDYCVTGGTIVSQVHGSAIGSLESGDFLGSRYREPGLIRLAYEAVIAQICIN